MFTSRGMTAYACSDLIFHWTVEFSSLLPLLEERGEGYRRRWSEPIGTGMMSISKESKLPAPRFVCLHCLRGKADVPRIRYRTIRG